jgi:hypothetical protein
MFLGKLMQCSLSAKQGFLTLNREIENSKGKIQNSKVKSQNSKGKSQIGLKMSRECPPVRKQSRIDETKN